MIGLFGLSVYRTFLLLWQFHWYIPGWWQSMTLSKRCELCHIKLGHIFYNILLEPPGNYLNRQAEDEGLVSPVIPLSSEHVNDDGIYLLENGVDCLIYIGNSVDSNILRLLFGISSAEEIPTQVVFCVPFQDT